MQHDRSSGKSFHLKRPNIVYNIKRGKKEKQNFTNCHSNHYPGNDLCYVSDGEISYYILTV